MTGIYIPLALRARVIRRARGKCEYCQSPANYSPEVFEIEHIVPLSAGGRTILGNLAFACPACNRYKGKRQSAIDRTTGEQVFLFNPRAHRWAEHFSWDADLTEIVGQSATGRVTVELLRMNRSAVKHFRAALAALGAHPAQTN